MPCDTVIRTTQMALEGIPDHDLLLRALKAAGWVVSGTRAYQGPATVETEGSAVTLRCPAYADQQWRDQVLGIYARQGVLDTVKPYGFTLRSEETARDGTRTLTFNRPVGQATQKAKARI